MDDNPDDLTLQMDYTLDDDGKRRIHGLHGTPEELRAFDARLLARDPLATLLPAPLPPELVNPPYALGALGDEPVLAGDWRTKRVRPIPIPGYFTGLRISMDNVLLQRRNAKGKWDTWMSFTPMEKESQAIPVMRAHGTLVVMGLGLGVVAWNMARRPEVDRVIVVERDPDVLHAWCYFTRRDTEEERAIHEKIVFVQHDALTWKPPADMPAIDMLYADIWLCLGEERAVRDVTVMQRNVRAKRVYYWGQEIDAMSWAFTNGRLPPFTMLDWIGFRNSTGLPLLGHDVPGYHNLVMRAGYTQHNTHKMMEGTDPDGDS